MLLKKDIGLPSRRRAIKCLLAQLGKRYLRWSRIAIDSGLVGCDDHCELTQLTCV